MVHLGILVSAIAICLAGCATQPLPSPLDEEMTKAQKLDRLEKEVSDYAARRPPTHLANLGNARIMNRSDPEPDGMVMHLVNGVLVITPRGSDGTVEARTGR